MKVMGSVGILLLLIVAIVYAAGQGEGIKGFPDVRLYTQTITPASVGAAVCALQTFTVNGLMLHDSVIINPAATGNATSAAQARVSAANTLAVMYCNPTAGALTPGAGTMRIVAIRHP